MYFNVFNPTPVVSLADAERTQEVYVDYAERNQIKIAKAQEKSLDDIMNEFMVTEKTEESSTPDFVVEYIESEVSNTPTEESNKTISEQGNNNSDELNIIAKQKEILEKQEKMIEELKIKQDTDAAKLREELEKAVRKSAEQEIEARIRKEYEEKARIEQERLEIERQRLANLEEKRKLEYEKKHKDIEIENYRLQIEKMQAEENARKAQEKESKQEQNINQDNTDVEAKLKRLEELRRLKAEREKKNKVEQPPKTETKEISSEAYDGLTDDQLLKVIRKFAKDNKLENKLIDKKLLENKFGKHNIKKLIAKSYLITIGKGVTFGHE